MVLASAKKKSKKKSAKRKAVNLQSNFNRKCSVRTSGDPSDADAAHATYEAVPADLFPDNHGHDHDHATDGSAAAGVNAGGFSCGDFHMHSIHSDGKLPPREVIAKAAGNGVQFMSLTDHDTMAGVAEAMETAQQLDVLVIPGVEISAEVKGGENLHILGYFYPGSNSAELDAQLEKIRTGRHKRGKEMLRKLATMGISLQWERVLEIAGEAAPGRPHVAEALVEGGFVSNFREAFARYLHNNGPAYAEGEHFPPEEALKLIADCGGVSVLAHPWCCKNPIALVPELAKMGLQGLEVYHDTNKIDMYSALAAESSLLKLGGSDFHGIDPTTEHAPGEIPLPKKIVDNFLAHAQRVWEQPLKAQLTSMAQSVLRSAGSSDELLIWKEQEAVARETLAALDVRMELVAPTSEASQYRTLRVLAPNLPQ